MVRLGKVRLGYFCQSKLDKDAALQFCRVRLGFLREGKVWLG